MKANNLTIAKIKSIYTFAIETYNTNMQMEGRSKTAEGIAQILLANYDNALVENDMVIGYYNNGCKNLPKFPKH